ncbi:MAG: carboxylate-amine ligase [Vicinamibacteria bacterium]|nr:carboxylate-amine ligase [Vicinamibacteria bacterium]
MDEELRQFEQLKLKLAPVWNSMTQRDDEPATSVVVPSLSLDQAELRRLAGSSFYEERLLFLLMRLRNPRARMVYVTSQPVHPMVLEYYFQFLAGIPTSHARSRLTLLCAYDDSPRSLTEKILERPRLLERIRQGILDKDRAYLTVFNSTAIERKLAVLLGIPLNGVDPSLNHLGTKSGSRKTFKEAGVALPFGFEDLRTEGDIADSLFEMRKRDPGLKRAVVKLNESFSGEGNALYRYPEESSREAIQGEIRQLQFSMPKETSEVYLDKFARMGGIVEEFMDADVKVSPSVQLRNSPDGKVMLISTHDQLLGGATGQIFLGCAFPADDEYRLTIQEAARSIGQVLAQKGVVSRFAIDFLACRNRVGSPWSIAALEINLRMGGTTHPFLALQFLTGGGLDESTGLFHSPSGQVKYYRATDNLKSEHYRGLLPEDLIEILTINRLHYSHSTESGALFHLIGAVSEHGKLGLTAIANSRMEVENIYNHTLAVLDRETAVGHPSGETLRG